MCSEFDLPWFDLDVREAKDSVRTTRSRAKAAKPSTAAESSGICTYRVPLHLIRGGGGEREGGSPHPKVRMVCVCVCVCVCVVVFQLMPTIITLASPFLMHTITQLRNPDNEWMQ